MKQPHPQRRQSGAALIVGLILLAILTVLTATSMNSSTLSLRMADNVKQADLAFKAAESVLNNQFYSGGPLTLDGTISSLGGSLVITGNIETDPLVSGTAATISVLI